MKWRRGQERGGARGLKQARYCAKLDYPLPGPAHEPVFGDGKDAFHRVPDVARKEWGAVERVLTKVQGRKARQNVGGLSPAPLSQERVKVSGAVRGYSGKAVD